MGYQLLLLCFCSKCLYFSKDLAFYLLPVFLQLIFKSIIMNNNLEILGCFLIVAFLKFFSAEIKICKRVTWINRILPFKILQGFCSITFF